MAVVLGFFYWGCDPATTRVPASLQIHPLAKMLIKSHIAGTVSAGEVKCSFSWDFSFYFRVPYCLNLRCILTNFAQFKVLCRGSMRRGTNWAWLVSFCYTFYARPDQEPHTRSEWYTVFYYFVFLCFSSLYFFPHFYLHRYLPPPPPPRPAHDPREYWDLIG